MTAAAPPASFGEMIAFWREGGMRLVEPLAPRDGEPRGLSILVQPDGDMVMGIPGDFGADPGDLAAGQALLGRVGEAIRRIGGDGYGELSRRIARLMDVGTGGAVIAGWMAAGLYATPLVRSAAMTAIVGGCRWVARRKMLPLAERLAVGWVRKRME